MSRSEPSEQTEKIGRWLARQRELRDIDLHELAARTRIPLRSLERLEAGAFDGQLDGFVRGFVRTVALELGLDPDDAVARMLSEPGLDPGAPRRRRISFQAVAAFLTLALLFVATAAAARWLFGVVSGPSSPARAVVRHDPVRALAAAQRDVELHEFAVPLASAASGGESSAASSDAPQTAGSKLPAATATGAKAAGAAAPAAARTSASPPAVSTGPAAGRGTSSR